MTIELKTGIERENRREDYITKQAGAPLDREMSIPQWTAFLDTVTDHNVELQKYLQRVCGYCTTGVTIEHVLFFFYGTGANGKSVFLGTIRGVLGDYATTAPMEMLMESKNERHPTELARLMGVRLVIAQELERNQRWAESKIKSMTGGDKITARFMRQDFFEFTPKFKLMIAGNHKPSLRGVDEAIRRRIHLIPFTVTIPPQLRDKQLAEKLRTEWPGILAWCLEGCLEYQRVGLNPPKTVLDATAEYLRDQDTLGQWIDECCNRDEPTSETLSSKLYANWKDWAQTNGLTVGSNKTFTQALIDRGFARKHTKKGSAIVGLTLQCS
jgi:P4 family phage/plasmid primase-like protien